MKRLINVLVLLATLFLTFQSFHAKADYDPTIQRWIEMDPIGEAGGINLYRFNFNNPLSFIDPFGLDPAFSPGISMFSGLTAAQQVNASRAAAPGTVALVAGMATGGAADALLVGGGFLSSGSLASSMTLGGLSWLGGDAGYQGTKIALGDQKGFDFGEFGLSGLVGTGVGAGGYALGAVANKIAPLLKTKCPAKNVLPQNDSMLSHIFRDAEGHLADTAANRQLLESIANDAANTLGVDKYGNSWLAKTLSDGTQVWVQARNGQIINGGLNQVPRIFNSQTGLSSPVKPGG